MLLLVSLTSPPPKAKSTEGKDKGKVGATGNDDVFSADLVDRPLLLLFALGEEALGGKVGEGGRSGRSTVRFFVGGGPILPILTSDDAALGR